MEKFKVLPWYQKIAVIAATLTSMSVILAYAGLSFPQVVWAEEFRQFQKEYYVDKLEVIKKDLRQVKMDEYRLQQKSEPIPEFIIEEKMELEDALKVMEKRVDNIEQKEHAVEE